MTIKHMTPDVQNQKEITTTDSNNTLTNNKFKNYSHPNSPKPLHLLPINFTTIIQNINQTLKNQSSSNVNKMRGPAQSP